MVCSRPQVCRPSRSLSRGQCFGGPLSFGSAGAGLWVVVTSDEGGFALVDRAWRCCFDQDLKSVHVRHGADSFVSPGWCPSADGMVWNLDNVEH